MEFPTLGAQCALTSCKQLDFLPMKCDACADIFCKDHVKYEEHHCSSAYKKDVQVPVCPLCNKPVPIAKGESPDVKVGQHIDRDCQSDPAQQKRKTYTNRCSMKGCKQKELVPVLCDSCRRNFCLRHRHEQDHNCATLPANRPQGRQQQSSSVFKAGNAAMSRAQAANKSKPQQTSLSSIGQDLDRARRERTQQQQRQAQPVQQPAMSEDEALRLAIQASLNDAGTNTQSAPPQNQTLTTQEQEDLALAQALAESEREEQERRRRAQGGQSRQGQDKTNCSVS